MEGNTQKETALSRGTKLDMALLATATLVVTLLYLQTMHYPFISWDDQVYITQNKHLAFSLNNLLFVLTHSFNKVYVPFTMLTFMVDYSISGLGPAAYRIQNLFWHLICIYLVYYSFRHFKIKRSLAFCVVLIWAIHPQRVESVAWISERKDVLCGAFYFLAILLYLNAKKEESFHIWPFVCFVLALLAKPMAVSLPFILIAYDFYRHRKTSPVVYLKRFLPYFAVDLAFVLIAVADHSDTANSWIHQLGTIPYNLSWYVQTSLLPMNLCYLYPRVVYDLPTATRTCSFFAFCFLIVTYTWLNHRRLLLFGALPIAFCFLVSISPVVGSFQNITTDYADRFSYIPSVFLWFGLSCILNRLATKYPSRLRLIVTLLLLYCLFLTFRTYHVSRRWRSRYTLVRDAYAYPSPNLEVIVDYALSHYKLRQLPAVDAASSELRDRTISKIEGGAISRPMLKFFILANYFRWIVETYNQDSETALRHFSVGEKYVDTIDMEDDPQLSFLVETILNDADLPKSERSRFQTSRLLKKYYSSREAVKDGQKADNIQERGRHR